MNEQDLRNIMLNKIHGYQVTQAIFVALKLEIPKHIGNKGKKYTELAKLTNSHPGFLLTLLRVLLNEDIVSEDASGKFQLTILGKYLKKEDENSVYGLALIHGAATSWNYWKNLFNLVKYGRDINNQPPVDNGTINLSYEEDNSIFIESLCFLEAQETIWMIKKYRFSSFRTLLDIGGGQGSLAFSILKKYNNIKIIMFGNFTCKHVKKYMDRCKNIQGNFLTDTYPFHVDCCVLRHVIHNLSDQEAITLLTRCKLFLNASGKIILTEIIKDEAIDNNFSSLRELHTALTMRGGTERTKHQYQFLAQEAGLSKVNFIQLKNSLNVIEMSK